MNKVDLSLLPEYLKSRRWFAGKAWPIKQVVVVDHATLEISSDKRFTIGVIEVQYELGKPERYLLPVTVDEAGRVFDALEEDVLARRVLSLIRDGAVVPSGNGQLRGERAPGSENAWKALAQSPSVRRLSAEQSNTSVVFGDEVIIKLIRKLEQGVSPELEIGRFLARKGFTGAPALLGALHLTGTAETTIAVAHRYAPSEGDGWGYVLDVLKRGATNELYKDLELLGRRLGELHSVLASDFEDPAFAPEPLQTEDLQRWSSSIVGELGVSLAAAASTLPQLLEHQAALTERAKRLAALEASGQKIRVHGDLHLGQVLRTQGDWLIFDFEGEPARSFLQRREKHSALKDVAGMLRSFAYVSQAAGLPPEGAKSFLSRSRDALLKGYLAATRGASFLAKDEATVQGMLDALELEKVLYELRYELNHRPEWVAIPARALIEEKASP